MWLVFLHLCPCPSLSLMQSFPTASHLTSFFFPSTSISTSLLHLSLTPRLCKAYKSRGDRLVPLGISQPRIGAKVAHQIWLLFVLKPRHVGIFTWRAQIPVILAQKRGRKGYTHGNSPRTIKGYNNRYFQGTKLQVIFRLWPLVGLSTTIVALYCSFVTENGPSR